MSFLHRFRSGRPDLHPKTSILASAKALIDFLHQVDQYPALYLNHHILREAINRYEHRWIPLLASVPPKRRLALVPPLDVEWVWYCHMLCPGKYIADSAAMWSATNPSNSNEHIIVDHKFPSEQERRHGIKRAEKLWRTMFPNAQFHVLERLGDAPIRENEADKVVSQNADSLVSRITYNIVAAAKRQMAFYYQVAYQPQYNDDKFLRHSVDRYLCMFLELQIRFPGEVWIPTYDIDLMWRAHIMYPVWYKESTEQLRGSVLPYDDSLSGGSAGSELSGRWIATTEKWKTLFQEPVICNGGMWRGNVNADERIARSKIKELISRVEDIGKKSRGSSSNEGSERNNITLKVFYGGDISWENTAQGWVHMTDYRRSNANLSPGGDNGNKIERLTFLYHKRSSTMLKCRTIHFVMRDELGKAYDLRTVLEVFSIKSNVPVATAHNALPHSICETGSKVSEGCKKLPLEMMMVLRVCGVDFGLLGGEWVGFDKLKKGKSYVRDRRESAGYLSLRLYQHERGKKFVQIERDDDGDDKKPGRYSFELPVFENGKMVRMCRNSFDLSDGSVIVGDPTQVVVTYLISMTAAALHVCLQLKFEPEKGRNAGGSMYPAWSRAQLHMLGMS